MLKSKTIKTQRTFQNWSKILKLQKSFTTYKWGIMYVTCSKKVVAYYTRKHINFKNQIFVMIWNSYHFKRWNIKFTRNEHSLKKSYLFQYYYF
jgi:hypothetical protein